MTEGQQIEFWQGAGKFRKVREGVVLSVLETGKIHVAFIIGTEETTALISAADVIKGAVIPPPPIAEPHPAPEFDAGPEEPMHDDITEESIIVPVVCRYDILGEPARVFRTIQRHHIGDSRYYVEQELGPDGNWLPPCLYVGVTSIGKAVLPTPRERVKWYCSFPSFDHAMEELNLLSVKGTIMHSYFAKAIMGELPKFGTSEMDRYLRGEITKHGIDPQKVIGEWTQFMYKALIGFKQFCHDRRVVFLAVEVVVGTPHSVNANGEKVHGYFAQIDFIVEMDKKHYQDGFQRGKRAPLPEKPSNGRKPARAAFNSRRPWVTTIAASTKWEWSACEIHERGYRPVERPIAKVEASVCLEDAPIACDALRHFERIQPWIPYPDFTKPESRERVTAIIDAKSGKHDYEDHDLQLALQIPLVKETFPSYDWSNLKVYNWHPSDWRESSVNGKMEKGEDARFGYNEIDKTHKMDMKWANDTLEYWRAHYAEELPMKVLYKGDANIATHPSENVEFAKYEQWWESQVARATKHKFADL